MERGEFEPTILHQKYLDRRGSLSLERTVGRDGEILPMLAFRGNTLAFQRIYKITVRSQEVIT